MLRKVVAIGLLVALGACTAPQVGVITTDATALCSAYQIALKADPALAVHNKTLTQYGSAACAAAPVVIATIPVKP